MKSKLFLGLVLLLITLLACSASIQKKIVGTWDCITTIEGGETFETVMTINSDNTLTDTQLFAGIIKWKIYDDEKPFQIEISNDKEFVFKSKFIINFISNNEMKWIGASIDGEKPEIMKVILTRIK